ncbi:class I SAM-dependent methyltransferase [Streptomyces antarcticus]|uniref:class I SAM-dependent methyltransferase n=1 Tax=Streptomyces antarcticus TaxID=2996458 RepID=UPI002271DDCE|nr:MULTISPECIES: class I SAM-dependent methyltransferase [unclassified Streptomyces]MCY0946169.1 class I SAM-dependent methyltransferase [Streptomyces sp. H34-AA3]MCZ4084979.1 class I SAM-dependent methyltransferase [Streptomyces sp. H34-S5]
MTSKQNDQYANIGDKYSDFKDTAPLGGPETNTVFKLLGELKGAKVLDLACGHGHYTRLIKQAGAQEVVGSDLSPVMIDLAKEAEAEQPLGITYHVGDASDLPTLGSFDVVSAVWLLNYATTKDELTAMLRGVHRNLAPGGRFVTVTVSPEFDPHGPELDAYGIQVVKDTPYEDRSAVTMDLLGANQTATITTSRWTAAAYAECLEAAGFASYDWRAPEIPEEYVQRFGDAFWNNYRSNPNTGFLVATRTADLEPGAE